MAIPHEPKVVDKFTIRNYWTSTLVFLTFVGIDFIYYGLIHVVTPYSQDLVAKLIWTAVLALSFTAIYNHAASWRPNVADDLPGKLFPRMVNSVIFSLLVYALILSAIALSCYLVSVTFIYLLDGFRGIPESATDNVVLGTKIISGGIVLELCGKDETQEGRTGG